MVEIDGSYGSGGGQILRTACALSVATKKPCHVFDIRKGREKPGLMPQHLLGIRVLSQLCNGKLEGDFLGSQEIKFHPGEIDRGPSFVNVKIETAGSITLVLQTLIPIALFNNQPIKITFDGGATDTFFSPTIDYFQYVFLKILAKMTENSSLPAEINLIRRGYYPEGGAKVEVKICPSRLKNLNLTKKGKLQKALVISGASEFLKKQKVAERQIQGIKEILGRLELPIEEKIEYYQTQCPGSQICLVAEFENTIIGADNLGKFGRPAEQIGNEAALELLKEEKSGACLDKHLADQILPYIALSPTKSQITVSEVTNHCKTNIWVIEKFIPGKFEIKNNLIIWSSKNL